MTLSRKIIGIIIVIVAIVLTISAVSTYTKLKRAQGTIEEARATTAKLEEEQKTLEDQISQAESSEFVEKQLRDKLGMAKEGETVLVLPDPQELKKLAPPRASEEEYVPKKNWEKWRELFF